mmetsp:Transcript_5989/g.23258  ORF Transcript_5989/g.23258 Transcript_5989/m.23258 type:complete len:278 (-) Transcript_5989:103-936(-)
MLARVAHRVQAHQLTRCLSTSPFEFILSEKKDKAGLITFNRPKALNALCAGLIEDVIHACEQFQADDDVGAIVITGSDRAFAAGADITEMKDMNFVECYKQNMFARWADLTKTSKPIIAAVNGYALGGGCELAMMCDMIIAGESAQFGQPEITLGVIPGGGGTQRLIRAVGKAKAMDMILTARRITAEQAERDGLVARVVPDADTLSTALEIANTIAGFSQPAVQMCKETVNAADELSLQEGLRFERRMFHACFGLEDQKEGMAAFVEKRKAEFKHK